MTKKPHQLLTVNALEQNTVEDSAKSLIGSYLVKGPIRLKITEVEAYGDEKDTASHARFGKTSRNEPMFGPAGRAYVYLCYGIHQMLNVVVGPKRKPAAILIRSVEVIDGLEIILERRRQKAGPGLLVGPGKIGQALALDATWNDHDLLADGGLRIIPASESPSLISGPRIGIDFAEEFDHQRCWRFADANSRSVKDRLSLSVVPED